VVKWSSIRRRGTINVVSNIRPKLELLFQFKLCNNVHSICHWSHWLTAAGPVKCNDELRSATLPDNEPLSLLFTKLRMFRAVTGLIVNYLHWNPVVKPSLLLHSRQRFTDVFDVVTTVGRRDVNDVTLTQSLDPASSLLSSGVLNMDINHAYNVSKIHNIRLLVSYVSKSLSFCAVAVNCSSCAQQATTKVMLSMCCVITMASNEVFYDWAGFNVSTNTV